MLGLFEIEEKDEEKIGLIADGKSRIKRLTDNIEKMLTDIKLNEKKSVVLQRQSYDIETRCREIMKDLQVIYSNKNITIDFEIAQNAQTIYVDAFYFDNCLRNLLDNSIKYSHNNPVIKVAAQKEKNNTFISVTDNGKGISKRDQRHIFSSFFRSRNATSEAGHGIGLSAVQQIIKEHDGKIKLKSELGKGSEFIITLPDKK
jgi:two-component system phosphate regulon sensor histidine kinase PhoR